MIGQTISHYKITAKLGAGGMGEVYLATDLSLDRQVALKFLPESLRHDPEARARLIREAKAASKLHHPNILTIHAVAEDQGRDFIVMEYVEGTALTESSRDAQSSLPVLLDIAIAVADGLQKAHAAGVIHRDIKPANILIDSDGRPRILDFGIAKVRGADKLTKTGSTTGTAAYMSPEQVQGRDIDARSDLFSFGVVLYEMIAGRLPFLGDHQAALAYAIVNETPEPLARFKSDVPPELDRIVAKLLAKPVEERYQSAADLNADLRALRRHATNVPMERTAVIPSMAVLPFTNMSPDPDNEYFSDGLSEELMNVLAKNPALKVTGRTSSFAFKGKHEDLRDIGQKLGVEMLLEGSVRKAGNRVRITAQLVKAADGFHLWSETYDRVLDDIFAVQDDIAQSVASAMNVALLGKAKAKARGNAESYSLVLRGNHFALRMTRESLEKAKSLYMRALDADPTDARAWAGLANVLSTQSGYGFEDVQSGIQKAKEAGEKALALDDTLAEAFEILGWIHMAYGFDWKKAGEAFRRSCVLAPGSGNALAGLASYESCIGDMDEAIRLAARSVELDPLSPSAFLYAAKVFASALRYEKALEFYGRALELSPGTVSAHAGASFILVLMGRPDEALAEAQREAPSGYRYFACAIAFHALGRTQESDESLSRLIKEGEQWAFQFACVYAFRCEADLAFSWLERAYVLRDSGISLVKRHPLLSNLHDDPRWLAFLKKTGLTG